MTQVSKKQVVEALVGERRRLASFVEGLSEEGLNGPSLCDGWRVRDVLSHLISFELNHVDILRVLFGVSSLDDVTKVQVSRYSRLTRDRLVAKLAKGLKRTRIVVALVPGFAVNKKFIKIRNGWVSPGQLFGDLVADRAIHFVDIVYPINGTREIANSDALGLTVDFMLSSMYLLNKKLAETYRGKVIRVRIYGAVKRQVFWRVGSSKLSSMQTTKPDLVVESEANDFIFTVTGRKILVKQEPVYEGDKGLARDIENLLNSNAFWD